MFLLPNVDIYLALVTLAFDFLATKLDRFMSLRLGPLMSDRRDQLSRKFFNSTLQPTSPLHRLLPPPRDQPPVTSLQAASKIPRIPTRTKKVSVLSLVCPSPLSDLTRSSPNHYDCILLIIVLYYCVFLLLYLVFTSL